MVFNVCVFGYRNVQVPSGSQTPQCRSLRQPANPSSCEKLQEFGGADDPDAAKLFQLQQVLISADDVLRMALKSAFEDHVIFGVAADCLQRLGQAGAGHSPAFRKLIDVAGARNEVRRWAERLDPRSEKR